MWTSAARQPWRVTLSAMTSGKTSPFSAKIAAQQDDPPAQKSAPSPVGKTTAVNSADLQTFHKNPRRGDVDVIAASLKRHGQYKPITVNVGTKTGRPNEVLAGNHTLLAHRSLRDAAEPDQAKFWDKILVHWVDVDDDTADRIVVADNQTGQVGGFDVDVLAELVKGFGDDIEGLGFTDVDVAELLALSDGVPDDLDPLYSDKVDIPHYVPAHKPPKIEDLLDSSKTETLIDDIEAADIPEDVKEFLIDAAARHTVINFHAMADYYAHAEPRIQKLMENQALVIIDVKDAIKQGYVKLTSALRANLDGDLEDGADEE
jgi:hypothetical protein